MRDSDIKHMPAAIFSHTLILNKKTSFMDEHKLVDGLIKSQHHVTPVKLAREAGSNFSMNWGIRMWVYLESPL